MRCTYPRTVGFYPDGQTICWSQKKISKEYATFQLPCGKCLECRLDYARQWAVRCVHEAKMHEKNSFITLTYTNDHLPKDGKLHYPDFQKFMKRLRRSTKDYLGVFVTGEYGEETKRPHWHAIIFGWRPSDLRPYYKNKRGDQLYTSATLDRLWGLNDSETRPNEIGNVSFHSAGYCARYAAKKLVHGQDQEHDFHPLSKKSNKNAIGKSFLEQYWPDVFNQGQIILPDGGFCSIPRYYEKWFKENHPAEWLRYVTDVKTKKIEFAAKKTAADAAEELAQLERRRQRQGENCSPLWRPHSRKEARLEILNAKFRQLQDYLKL